MTEESVAARLVRYREAWLTAPEVAEQPGSFPSAGRLEPLWQWSEFFAQACVRSPTLIGELCRSGIIERPYAGGEMAARLERLLTDVDDETGLERALRQFRRREMLRIVWRDLGGLAGLDETLEDLSELADVCIRQALALLHGWAVDKSGTPRDGEGREQRLIVLAMGKLGARELNLSSDIDLIFCYPERGQTDGRRPLDNEAFFTRLGRHLVQVLSRQTADGFVFRVDMRLRPFGESGPLVVTRDAMEHYYQTQAREWERYAMVKARAITGDPQQVHALTEVLRAFVYRRYIDFGVIESIREMKRLIEAELHKKGMDANIKLGQGGIREIEFVGQAFQLVRGGRDPELQIRPIQQVLTLLGERGLLPDYAVHALIEAYRFMRLTENRIQAWRDEQTHSLPTDEDARQRLAHSMGFDAWTEFAAALETHRRRVHEQFGHVFAAPQVEHATPPSALAAVWHTQADAAGVVDVLGSAGFTEADTIAERLRTFRDSALLRTLSARGRNKLDRLMPLLIEAAAQTDRPDVTLARLLDLVGAVARRTAYLVLLIENPLALSQVVRLVSESSWVVSQLIHQPLLLDEMLDPRRLYSPLHTRELSDELKALMASVEPGDVEQEMERLRQFSQGNRLRVAAADIVGAIPLMVVSDFLSEIAEVTLRSVVASAWRDMREKYGQPGDIDDLDTGFAIIGYGKLGGIELGYGSDLDMVFLHGSQNLNAVTDGRRSVSNDVFYARMGQRVIHMLSTRTPSGLLYEADMRLRPNGNSGPLVASLGMFERYLEQDAWVWELQALVRARAVAGDPVVVERFNRIRRDALSRARDPEKLRTEVVTMRDKMRTSLDTSTDDAFHIKHGVGGMVDIEFMVQYAVLRWAHNYPDLVDWTDNARLLERLAQHNLMPDGAAEQLWNAYQVYRNLMHRRSLQEQGPAVPAEQLSEERLMVRDIWRDVLKDSPTTG
jgi:glutamate-ammonia-ligase adenylyltransferase